MNQYEKSLYNSPYEVPQCPVQFQSFRPLSRRNKVVLPHHLTRGMSMSHGINYLPVHISSLATLLIISAAKGLK